MEQKKPTKQQLESKINKSLVFVERDKNYKIIYFNDKGLKLETTSEYAIVSTNYHKHVFDAFTSSGVSKPYIYVNSMLDIAIKHVDDIKITTNGETYVSYALLNTFLKEHQGNGDAEKNEFAIFFYVDMWLYNIFTPLYEISEMEATQFMTFQHYVENIVRHKLQLAEHKEDVTNKNFANDFIDEFNAVIIIRVVGGRNHNAAVKIIHPGDIGDRRRCCNMHDIGICPAGHQPRAECILKKIRGTPGILPYHNLCLSGKAFPVIPAQKTADFYGMLKGKIFIGFPTEPVGSEIFSHKQNPFRIAFSKH